MVVVHRRQGWRAVAGVAFLVGLVSSAPAAAQDDGDAIDDATLQELKDLIPASDADQPGLNDADSLFGKLADAVGSSRPQAGGGSSVTGPCGGYVYSYDSHGKLIDAAADMGDDGPPIDLLDGTQAFTSGNRFKVDTRGVVTYYGFLPRAGEGPRDHSWSVELSGSGFASGGDDNASGKNRRGGSFDLGDKLPFGFAAKLDVSGHLTSSNLPECKGDGKVELIGPGLNSLVGLGGIVLGGVGLAGLIFNARPGRKWKVA